MKKQAVIFDMDGVIFDSEKLSIAAWKSVAQKAGLQDMEKMILNCIGITRNESKKKLEAHYGSNFSYDDYKKEVSHLYRKWYEEGKLEMKEGAMELLIYLKENKIPIGLATSTRYDIVKKELEDYDIIKYFDAVICGDMVEHGKPEPDIYIEACEQLACEPTDCYAIEDSYNGVWAAYRAGMKVIMVPDILKVNEEMKQITYAIRSNLMEVKEMFIKNN